jgi:ankyrin repeat protein
MKKYSVLAILLMVFSLPLGAQALLPPGPAEQALMESAFNGDLEGVQRLLADGANVNATGMEQRSALMGASFNGHTAVADLLAKGDR